MSTLLDLRTVRELALLEVGPGDSFLPHFLNVFSGDAHTTLERLREKIHNGDARDLAREARRLSAASASIGAIQLARELAEIELGARRGPSVVLEARVAHALEVLYASCDAILRLCHRPPSDAKRTERASSANGPAGAP
jgi:HPt (histidine-containing phosphotransfer) domain-containing protein